MAIVVEDGTGLATADSYLSVAGMTTYVAAFMRGNVAWSGATTANQEEWLREGTQALDLLFAARWRGVRSNELQALAFPRRGIKDNDGFTVDADTLPTKIANACAEMTWRAMNVGGEDTTTGDSTKLIADDSDAVIASESVAVGGIKSSTSYMGGKSGRTEYRKVAYMLAAFITIGGSISRG